MFKPRQFETVDPVKYNDDIPPVMYPLVSSRVPGRLSLKGRTGIPDVQVRANRRVFTPWFLRAF